jgi:hypothetical protein
MPDRPQKINAQYGTTSESSSDVGVALWYRAIAPHHAVAE